VGDPASTEAVAREDALVAEAGALYRYARARVRDRQTAEDLVQETMVAAIAHPEAFAGRAQLRTWLIGILRHKVLDHHRWRRRHPGDQPVDEAELGADPHFTSLGVWRTDPNAGLGALDGEQALDRAQLRDALRACIERLPAALHRAFVLRALEEREPAEVSEALGISRESLNVFLYRARQALRACLQQTWGTP